MSGYPADKYASEVAAAAGR